MPDNIKELTKRACELCEKNFSYDELFEILKNGTDDEKQICILKIPRINSQQDADLLLFHLTNQHGTVREAAAEKINELMKNGCANFFQTDFAREKLLCAINDVNPNICRFIIEILPLLNESQKKKFFDELYDLTLKVSYEARELNVRNRSHVYTKKIFNLYWCLETISAIVEKPSEKLGKIIEETFDSEEYTIREKTAKFLKKVNAKQYAHFFKIMQNDENFYVKLALT